MESLNICRTVLVLIYHYVLYILSIEFMYLINATFGYLLKSVMQNQRSSYAH